MRKAVAIVLARAATSAVLTTPAVAAGAEAAQVVIGRGGEEEVPLIRPPSSLCTCPADPLARVGGALFAP
ncbi:hypothetical protein [Streptomyces sp. NBC_00057]|uniref:hypothetical protein n=1 Tax=Streptomyces sp. NBC_00057 TaxID=2975634 RepID=UPI003245FD5C